MDPLLFWSCYVGLAVICTIAELTWPAHKLRYRKVLLLDLIALVVYQFAVTPLAIMLSEPVARALQVPTVLLSLWLPLRLLLLYLAADCGSYWMHRLMHTRALWRVHRWHHSPTQLYWLSGVRATLPQQLLFNAPYVVAGALLVSDAPEWLIIAVTLEGLARNNWMHMNVRWRLPWLEYVVVTPRYHHIHHSADAALHDRNFGSLFSIWDRLFGTYVDPEAHKPRSFGTGENKRDPVLLMIGV